MDEIDSVPISANHKKGCAAMTKKSLCEEFGFVAGVDVPQEPMSVPLEHLESMCQTRQVLKGDGRYQCDPGSVDR